MIYLMDTISIITLIVSMINAYYIVTRLSNLKKEEQEKRIEEAIRQYLMSDEFKQFIKDIIETSSLKEELTSLRVILCANIPELRDSRLCNHK